jgi:hypothetical protein
MTPCSWGKFSNSSEKPADNRGRRFLRKVGYFLPNQTASRIRRQYSLSQPIGELGCELSQDYGKGEESYPHFEGVFGT